MDWDVNHSSSIPLHAQVESLLRELIQKEEYQNGKLLPGETEIARRLGVSRNTVREAMKRLVQEGLIKRKKGVGSRVNPDTVRTGLRAWSSFTREMERKGMNVRTLEKDVYWTGPPNDVVNGFQIDPERTVCRLDRLRGDGKEPVVLFESYFHPRININQDETFDGLLYEVIRNRYNIDPVISEEEIGADLPDDDLQEKLDISTSTPILYRKRLVYDAGDRPIEYCYCYYRSDRFEYSLRIHRDDR